MKIKKQVRVPGMRRTKVVTFSTFPEIANLMKEKANRSGTSRAHLISYHLFPILRLASMEEDIIASYKRHVREKKRKAAK